MSETAGTSRIKQVRRALGDDGQAQRLVPRCTDGHPLVTEVIDYNAHRAREAAQPVAVGPTRLGNMKHTNPFTTSDVPTHVYKSRWGHIDIVLISGFVSHLDL